MISERLSKLKKDDFYFSILKHIDALGGSASVEEMNSAIIAAGEFTDQEQAAAHEISGALLIQDKINWGRSRLKLAGLLSSGGPGIWVLTDAGREALQQDDAAVRKIVKAAEQEYNKAYQAKRKAEASQKASSDEGSDGEPDNEAQWTELLLAKVKEMEPAAFERLSQRILRESGFTSVKVTGKSGDGGIDGYGVLRMNLISFQVLFQCKRYAGSVSAGTVRDFRGAMQGRADKGLIITTGTFTPDARREATRDGAPAIDLIDGDALIDLLKRLQLGVRVEQVVTEKVSLQLSFFDEI